jgi:hypothetical protein
MVIKKIMALFCAAAKPQETVDVCDVAGLCDAIDEVVKKRKQLPGNEIRHLKGSSHWLVTDLKPIACVHAPDGGCSGWRKLG